MRTIKFLTLGCKVNQYDTQILRVKFLRQGFKENKTNKPSNFYLINTCTVTQGADAKSRNLIQRARRENPKAKIIVAGCYPKLNSKDILKIPNTILLDDFNRFDINFDINKEKGIFGISDFSGKTRAFLKIQDGCNNFCSYCIVPYVRGKPVFRPLNEIKKEAENLTKNGFREIVLTGICLGSHPDLIKIIEELEKIPSLERIRLSSIEAGDVNNELIQKIKNSPPMLKLRRAGQKLCRHLHIPMQSGDDKVLKLMNRKYQTKDYLNLIKKIRKNIPDIAITTDIIVGFPTEDENNFKNTVDFLKKIKPSRTHIFSFSARQNTPAFNLESKINPKIIKERCAVLKKITDNSSYDYHKKFLNKKLYVLIEGKFKEKNGFWEGYSDNYIRVLVKSNKNLQNQLIPLKIKKIEKGCLLTGFC